LNANKGISVVIPNYNGAALLPQIIPALYEALAQVNLPHEVIISDDASVDGSTAYIRENFPQIILIENKINAGFPPTINKGIFAAQYGLVLLLNSDVKLTNGYGLTTVYWTA
jgi:GT2 family glycosyltransferase